MSAQVFPPDQIPQRFQRCDKVLIKNNSKSAPVIRLRARSQPGSWKGSDSAVPLTPRKH